MKLAEIAEIQIGYQHRDRGNPITVDSVGDYRIIQIKDLDLDGQFKDMVIERGDITPYIWFENLYQVSFSGTAERYLVNEGDVIFLSRGQRNVAVPLINPMQNTLVSNFFYRLRFDVKQIHPAYLAWHINHPRSQTFLAKQQRGATMKIVPKQAFAELEIICPPLEVQHKIIEVERLRQKEAYLMRKLVHKRQQLTHELGFQMINKYSNSQET